MNVVQRLGIIAGVVGFSCAGWFVYEEQVFEVDRSREMAIAMSAGLLGFSFYRKKEYV